jgi:short-subunit dehydrogenase
MWLALAGGVGFLAAGVLSAHQKRNAFSFAGKVVLVTGGSRGLGLRIASRCAEEGAQVVLVARNAAELATAQRMIEARGGHAATSVCDLTQSEQIDALVARITDAYGGVDVLVNNAGVIHVTPFANAQLSDFEESMALHFWAPLRLIRAFAPLMKQRGGGRIVNISSIGGRIGVPHLAPYCAGKFALAGLSDTLRAELARDQIAVTTVTPYLMRTGGSPNALVRGRHRSEAQWFAASSTLPVVAMSANRAAREIVEACRRGDARLTPGIEARLAEIANMCFPETTSAITAWVASHVLPEPADDPRANTGVTLDEIDLGPLDGLKAIAHRGSQVAS